MMMTAAARTNRPLLRSTLLRFCSAFPLALLRHPGTHICLSKRAKTGLVLQARSLRVVLPRRCRYAALRPARCRRVVLGLVQFRCHSIRLLFSKTADSETDRARVAGRLLRNRLSEATGFVGLLEARSLENQDASARCRANPPLALRKSSTGKLLGIGPDGVAHDRPLFHLAPQCTCGGISSTAWFARLPRKTALHLLPLIDTSLTPAFRICLPGGRSPASRRRGR